MTVLRIKSFKIRIIFKLQQYIKVFLQKFTLLYTDELYSWAHSFSGVLFYIIESRSASMVNKEMPPNNLRKPVAKFTDFIWFTLNKMRRLFSGSS